MAVRENQSDQLIINNRSKFLSSVGISIDDTTRLRVSYDGNDFCRYQEIPLDQKSFGMLSGDNDFADAIITRHSGHALFLTLADCVGTVIYDPRQKILMLSHLGRHSIEQKGGYHSVRFLVDTYHSQPDELLVWLTPAPGKDSYPLFAFDNRSIKDVVFEQLGAAGIVFENITDNATDTAKDDRYFSYSEFINGRTDVDGSHAIVAMMTDQ